MNKLCLKMTTSESEFEIPKDETVIKKRRSLAKKKQREKKKQKTSYIGCNLSVVNEVSLLDNQILAKMDTPLEVDNNHTNVNLANTETNKIVESNYESSTDTSFSSSCSGDFDFNISDSSSSEGDTSDLNDDSTIYLYQNSTTDINQFVTSFTKLIYKHKLSDAAANDVLKLFKIELPQPNKCPTNMNRLQNLLLKNCEQQESKQKVKSHFICYDCQQITDECLVCSNCNNELIEFVTFDVSWQISNIVNRNYMYINRKELYNSTKISKVEDGDIYRKSLIGKEQELTVSISFNSDGAPLLTSKSVSMWPVIAKIIELPDKISESIDNLIFIGLWLNEKKPNYECFMSKCVSEIVNATKMTCLKKLGNKKINIRCQSFIADLPARSAFLNVKQFNGYYGCMTCFHPGEYSTAHSKVIFKPDTKYPLKQSSHYELLAKFAEQKGEHLFGIKGTTSLSKIISIPNEVPYDYMHLVLQGHCKWLLNQIFRVKSSPSFISFEYKDEASDMCLNDALLQIKVPHTFNRKPRSLGEIKRWKSSEIKLFCFYLAVPLLINKLPSIYFCHFSCYVFAIRLLYEPVHRNKLEFVQEIIDKYIEYLGKYYGDYAYDFTIHAHSHLVEQVKQHGPLKSHSQFVFESALGNLKTFIHGSRGYLTQISNKILLLIELANRAEIKTNIYNDEYLLKPFKRRFLRDHEMDFFKLNSICDKNIEIVTSSRVLIKNNVYHSKTYNRKMNSNSYTICFSNKDGKCSYGEILEFFEYKKTFYAIIDVFQILNNEIVLPDDCNTYFYSQFKLLFAEFYSIINTKKCEQLIININRIECKCIIIDAGSYSFISKIKYDYEHD